MVADVHVFVYCHFGGYLKDFQHNVLVGHDLVWRIRGYVVLMGVMLNRDG